MPDKRLDVGGGLIFVVSRGDQIDILIKTVEVVCEINTKGQQGHVLLSAR